MLVEIYIMISVFSLITGCIALFTPSLFKNPNNPVYLVFWAITMVFFAFLAIQAYHIETEQYTYNSATLSYDTTLISHSYPALRWLFGLGILGATVMLLIDILNLYKGLDVKGDNAKNMLPGAAGGNNNNGGIV